MTGTPEAPVASPTPLPSAPAPLNSASEQLTRLAAESRIWKVPAEQLSDSEQVFKTAWEFYTETNRGGFKQYYLSDSGNHAYECPAALETIGADQTAELVRHGNSLFGAGGPPRDREMRADALIHVGDEQLQALDEVLQRHQDDLIALLSTYVRRNKLELHAQ